MCDDYEHDVMPVIFKQEFRFGDDDIVKAVENCMDRQTRIEHLIITKGAVYFKPRPNIGVHVETEKSTIFHKGHKESSWYKVSADFEVDFSSWADITLIRYLSDEEIEKLKAHGDDDPMEFVYGETMNVNAYTHHLRVRYTRIVDQLGGSSKIGVTGEAAYIENPTDEYHLLADSQFVVPPSSKLIISGDEDMALPKQCSEIIIT